MDGLPLRVSGGGDWVQEGRHGAERAGKGLTDGPWKGKEAGRRSQRERLKGTLSRQLNIWGRRYGSIR